MKYKIVVEKGNDGFFVAECVTLPGCVSQGRTLHSAISNISDAIDGYIASLKKHNEKVAEVDV